MIVLFVYLFQRWSHLRRSRDRIQKSVKLKLLLRSRLELLIIFLGSAQGIPLFKVTLLVHGEEGLRIAERTTAVLYKQDLRTLSNLNAAEARQIFQGAPYLRWVSMKSTNKNSTFYTMQETFQGWHLCS